MVDVRNISEGFQISKKDFAKKYLSITKYEFTIWDENLENSGNTKIMETLVLNFEQKSDCIFLFIEEGKKNVRFIKHALFNVIFFHFGQW